MIILFINPKGLELSKEESLELLKQDLAKVSDKDFVRILQEMQKKEKEKIQ